MQLVFAGTPEVALPCLEALVDSPHNVLAVVTRPDAPTGRGRKLLPSPVALRATELGIELLRPSSPRDEDFRARLEELAPQACPVVAYGALLPQNVLEVPTHGWINLHFSALPRWRGAAPVQHAIMAGDTSIGTTTFQIVRELDAGPIYRQHTRVMPQAPAGQVLDELAHAGAEQMLATLSDIEAGLPPTPQPTAGITLAPKLTVEDARLRMERPAQQLLSQILGCSPSPGAWAELEGARFKIFDAQVVPGNLAPGEFAITKHSVHVGTGSQALELLEVQAPGKRRMRALDWARGAGQGLWLH